MAALAAGISAGASILSGITGGKGADKAAKANAAAYQKGIDEQHAEFAQTQANFAPFLQSGTTALTGTGGVMDILGLNGNAKQGAAYDLLKGSPAFTSQYGTGQDTILQNAAATGGLRGGNTQNSLANFGANTLATVIQNQLSNLGGLVSTGAGAAGSLGSFGQASAQNVSNLLGQQGSANAAAAAAPYAAASGIFSQLGGQATGLSTLLGGQQHTLGGSAISDQLYNMLNQGNGVKGW